MVIVALGIWAEIPTVRDDICADATDAAADIFINGELSEAIDAIVFTFQELTFPL